MERSYLGTTATLNQARHDLADLLRSNELQTLVPDAELVLSELASNAIEASPDEPYRVALRVGPKHVVVAVTNQSSGTLPDDPAAGPDDVLARQGRGLMIVYSLSETVEISHTDTEITVSARLVAPHVL